MRDATAHGRSMYMLWPVLLTVVKWKLGVAAAMGWTSANLEARCWLAANRVGSPVELGSASGRSVLPGGHPC